MHRRQEYSRLGETLVGMDRMIRGLFRCDLPAPKAVGYTLLFRYLKRIDVHILNIATAVIAPVHEIDYMTEYLREEDESEPSAT